MNAVCYYKVLCGKFSVIHSCGKSSINVHHRLGCDTDVWLSYSEMLRRKFMQIFSVCHVPTFMAQSKYEYAYIDTYQIATTHLSTSLYTKDTVSSVLSKCIDLLSEVL